VGPVPGDRGAGGIIEALASGHIAQKVEATRAARPEPKIVGVTAFPPASETPVEVERPTAKPVEAPSPRLPGPDGKCPPLTPVRLAEASEGAR
jgi:methylmalonyl-CoA mutase